MVEWQNGRMVEWQNGKMVFRIEIKAYMKVFYQTPPKCQNGKMVKWQNGRMVEWQNGK